MFRARDLCDDNLAEDGAEFSTGSRDAITSTSVSGWKGFGRYLLLISRMSSPFSQVKLTMKVVVFGPESYQSP